MSNRIVLHIDMNSYFASVEQQANPHLRGKPVGVCEHLGGIIIAPSVEAKRLGIKLGTPVWEAVKIYPQIVFLPTDPDKYRHVTRSFLKIFYDYSDSVIAASIDEAFVDVTQYCLGNWNDALLLGLEIKQRMKTEVGEWISASIGIGPNKLVSKIAADLDGGIVSGPSVIARSQQTLSQSRLLREYARNDSIFFNDISFLDRICVIRPESVVQLYNYLNLTDIPGIGGRLETALHKLGIFSLRALADYPLENLLNQFGITGWTLHNMANFRDTTPVIGEEEPPKSFGHAYTVARSLTDERQIRRLMFKLSEKVGRRMRQGGARGCVVHYFHSDRQGSGFSRQRKLGNFIDSGKDIFEAARGIYSSSLVIARSQQATKQSNPEIAAGSTPRNDKNFQGVKIMGVSISDLRYDGRPEGLFSNLQKPHFLTQAADQINDKYGEYTIVPAALLGGDEEWAKDTVGFGRARHPASAADGQKA